jgi:hypothetical protein
MTNVLVFAAPILSLVFALEPVAPSASQEALYKALSGRDGAPSCEQLGEYSTNLAADLVFLTENAKKPAWVGVRAAECLVRHHSDAASPTIEKWLSSPDTRGFAILATNELDNLPAERAVHFAKIALQGPLSESLRSRLSHSIHAEVVALAGPAAPLRETEGVE